MIGRSGGIRTHGLLLPKQARYHLRYTPMEKGGESLPFLYRYKNETNKCSDKKEQRWKF